MSQKINFLDIWTAIATTLFSQALAGEPGLEESLPKPMPPGSEGFVATISGDREGRFAIVLDANLFESPLLGEGTDQKAGWNELLKETVDAAIGDMYAKAGLKLHLDSFVPTSGESKVSRAFQLKSADKAWTILVRDEVRSAKPAEAPAAQKAAPAAPPPVQMPMPASNSYDGAAANSPITRTGLEILLDVELEASLRFGAREMPLSEIMELGPGDVIQLDRHITDPVDLLVGDKIVAKGEVVLVNGNFGLRVLEVAEPQRRLESIRCLF